MLLNDISRCAVLEPRRGRLWLLDSRVTSSSPNICTSNSTSSLYERLPNTAAVVASCHAQ